MSLLLKACLQVQQPFKNANSHTICIADSLRMRFYSNVQGSTCYREKTVKSQQEVKIREVKFTGECRRMVKARKFECLVISFSFGDGEV